ncbi:MAG: hypothetical protein ACOC56_01800 [Atribacterota bacterium]
MKLEKYLLEYQEEGRSKPITLEKALSIVHEKCSNIVNVYKNNDIVISRFTKYVKDYFYIDPSKYIRRSTNNIPNFYTLLMDNLKAWSKYPKRSKSVCCSVEKYIGIERATHYLFPFDGAKFGVCRSRDIWDTTIDHLSIRHFAEYLKQMFDEVGIVVSDENFKEFKNKLIKYNDKIIDYCNKSKENFNCCYFVSYLLGKKTKESETLFDIIEKIFTPEKFKFKLVNINKIPSLTNNVEVWTDSKGILVNSMSFEKFIDKL